jgi:hypothetical protein
MSIARETRQQLSRFVPACLENLIENRDEKNDVGDSLWKIMRQGRTCGNEKSSEITDSSVISFLGFTAWSVSAQLPLQSYKNRADCLTGEEPHYFRHVENFNRRYIGTSIRCIVESSRLDLSARYEYSKARAIISFSSFGISA